MEFNNKKVESKQPAAASKNDIFSDKKKASESDNGLIADNDFGDDFEEEEYY